MRSLLIIFSILICACGAKKQSAFKPDYSPGPTAIVYKTKANYTKQVPVMLSDDKLEIISYPHPNDLKTGNDFHYPTLLENGYLLDNKGIDKNVAFLKYTYEEYSKLPEAPPLKTLMEAIINKDPFAEIYNCGNKKNYKNIEKQLNEIITNKKLKQTFKQL